MNPYGQSAGGGVSFDLKRLKIADYLVVAGTVLFSALAFFPWLTFGDDFFGFTATGWETGGVTSAFVLFLMATAWAILPAFVDLRLGFPRSWVTVGLALLAWLLTLFAWLDSFDGNFSIWALLGFLAATAILLFAVLSLLSEVRHRPAPSGGPVDAAQWGHQPAPQQGSPQQPYGGYGQPTSSPHEQPRRQYGTPPPPPPAVPRTTEPPPPGGSTASGEGSGTPGTGERPTA